jgi:hypothetical protein
MTDLIFTDTPLAARGLHFKGCGCILCEQIRAENPRLIRYPDGRVVPMMEGSDVDHPIASERERTASHVAEVLSDLRTGRCTRQESIDIESAARRAIADHDAAKSIGRL